MEPQSPDESDELIGLLRDEEFVEANLPEGLESSDVILQRLCKDDKEALDLIDGLIQAPPYVHNVNVTGRPCGNSEQAALRRLHKDRPDLLDRVKAGQLTAHAAMVEAGFRRREVSIPTGPEAAARRLRSHFSGDRLAALIAALQEDSP
jgi:hypothetical protein